MTTVSSGVALREVLCVAAGLPVRKTLQRWLLCEAVKATAVVAVQAPAGGQICLELEELLRSAGAALRMPGKASPCQVQQALTSRGSESWRRRSGTSLAAEGLWPTLWLASPSVSSTRCS